MRFLVAHVIKGEAGQYHERITRAISEQFGTEPFHLKLPPHITFVPPFEWADVRQPMECLKDAASFCKSGFFHVGGFDHFSMGTIFLSVVPSLEMAGSAEEIRKHFSIFKEEGRYKRPFHPHASVARFLTTAQFTSIWSFLEREDPDFRCRFENVSLLTLKDGKWQPILEVSLENGREPKPPRTSGRTRLRPE